MIRHYLLEKIRILGSIFKKILMIGDAPADILAARSAGVKIASVVWDAYAKEQVMKMESDYLFETVDELMKFLKENLE